MLSSSHLFLAYLSLTSAAVLRRAEPGFQEVPATGQPDNTFYNGQPMRVGLPVDGSDPVPDVYGARSIDLPFGRLYHGNMKFFSKGQLNTPDQDTDAAPGQPGVVDSAKQSACGIPDNAFSISKVAIHPYFLKYADLSRYCMQDVCISFWNGKQQGQGQSDMMLKVTDICSTDPTDPTHCKTPGDIKVDRTKVRIMEQIQDDRPLDQIPSLSGSEYTDGETWWFFTKCWADALVQPGYSDNWFAKPPLPCNLHWSQTTAGQQMANNNDSYPLHKPDPWHTYPNGLYNPTYNDVISPPIPDWSPGQPDPKWCPVAGGKGWGVITGDCADGAGQGSIRTSTNGTVTSASSPSSTAGLTGSGSTGSGSTGSGSTGSGSIDSGPTGSGSSGPGSTDSGSTTNSGSIDSGPSGPGSTETGSTDSGSTNSGSIDSGSSGSGSTGPGSLDSGSTGSGSLDSGSIGSGPTGPGSLDSGSTGSGSLEFGSTGSGSSGSESTNSGSSSSGSTGPGSTGSEPPDSVAAGSGVASSPPAGSPPAAPAQPAPYQNASLPAMSSADKAAIGDVDEDDDDTCEL